MRRLFARFYLFVAGFTLLVLLVGGAQYNRTRTALTRRAEEAVISSNQQLYQDIDSWLAQKSSVVSHSANLLSDLTTRFDILGVLQTMLAADEDFASLYFLSTANEMINASGWVPPEGMDLRLRPWYQRAHTQNSVVFTDVFLNASQDQLIVTVAQPVYDHLGELSGVVGGDVSIQTIVSKVEESFLGETGFSFMIDSQGHMLAHSGQDTWENLDLPVPSQEYQTLITESASGQDLIPTKLAGETGFVSIVRMANTGWHLATFIGSGEFWRSVNQSTLGFAIFLTSFIVFVLIFAIFLRRYILSPVMELERNISRIDLDKGLSFRLPLSIGGNFTTLTKTLNQLLDKVEGYFQDMREAEGELFSHSTQIERLHEVVFALNRAETEEEACLIAAQAAEGILNFVACTVDLVEGDQLVVKATSSGIPEGGSRNMPIDCGLAGKTYRTQRTYRIADLAQESEARPVNPDYRSCISMPIGQLGVFQVISSRVNVFSDEDVRLAEILVSHVAEAVRRIRSEAEIRHISFHDRLTDLYNRAFFEEELMRLDSPRQLPLSIIIGDINGLKLANDAFGHHQGDKLLQSVAKILKDCCRQEDIVARWGGDEFAILLPCTQQQEALTVVRRIKSYCDKGDSPLPISIALGVATKREPGGDVYATITAAEETMYRNKLLESRSVRHAIIHSLEKTLLEKSNETEEHTYRIQQLAIRLGEQLSLSTSMFDELALLASLHDIGKIAISEEIINKPGTLSEEEWEEIKKHPEIGYRIALASPELAPIAEGILSHHEWWNGSGYPRGLTAEEVPLSARIISILDAYDVMINGRPYKSPMTQEEALTELRRCAGQQFDPRLVELFISTIKQPPIMAKAGDTRDEVG